jgi:beta-1,4-mannosyltransferase
MEGRRRSIMQPGYAFTDEALAALRALQAADDDPLVLAYHPVARMNPYQALLYGRAWTAGIAPVPLVRMERIAELIELARLGIGTLLHLHWINVVMRDAGTPGEARKRGVQFLRVLDRYRDAGGRIAWTIHNVLPHGARFEAEEAWLRGEVAARCDVVHVLAASTLDQAAEWFAIPPERVLNVPHPSYAGAYEDFVSREQARHELGIMPDEIVHVVVGALKPYKGLNALLDAWDDLPVDGPPRRLLVAGQPDDVEGVNEFVERAAIHPSVLLHARPIPSHEMQIFLRAADVAVLPYLRTLNSGAQLLALTFGLPVVVPADGGLAELVDERCSRTFVAGDRESLAAALVAADELVTPAAREAALAVAATRPPGELSERFAVGLRSLLRAGTATATGVRSA